MKRPYKAVDVAKYIITKCTRDEHPISNLQLQKILYILQKEYLQRDQKCLFFDDFEAWAFGPNIPNVYYYFCGFGSMPIQAEYDIKLDLKDTKIIDPVVERKRNLKPWDLLPETQNGVWNIVYQKGEQNVIPLDEEDLNNILKNCYTGNDFLKECNGCEKAARALFGFVDWQHPNIQDLVDLYDDEEDEFFKEFGIHFEDVCTKKEKNYDEI